MLGRFLLSTDRNNFTSTNLPLALLTVVVDGRNTGSKNPREREIVLAVWDGLEDEEKIMLMTNKSKNEIIADDYHQAAVFDLQKLTRSIQALEKLNEGTGKSKFAKLAKNIYIIKCLVRKLYAPKVKTADGDYEPFQIESLEDNFLDVLNQLDFPPVNLDRLDIKLRLYSTSATTVSISF